MSEKDGAGKMKNSSSTISKSNLDAYQSYNSISELPEEPESTKAKQLPKKHSYSSLPYKSRKTMPKIN